jgi:hypothetical protein
VEKTFIELRYQLKEAWPNLRYIWMWDRNYYLITKGQLDKIIEFVLKAKVSFPDYDAVEFDKLYNMGEYFDCDNFAAGGDFLAKLYGKLLAEKGEIPRLPIAFGQARGNEFRQIPMLHALNIAVTQEGIYFIDFDDRGRIWQANKDWDSIFYVSF